MKLEENLNSDVVWQRLNKPVLSVLLAALILVSNGQAMTDQKNIYYGLASSSQVILTSESGDKLANKENVSFIKGAPASTLSVIKVNPENIKQTLMGIGSSFTESSAFVLAHLAPAERAEVMSKIFSESGANFSLARTPIGATDFSVEGKYSYADVPNDKDLEHFSIDVDRDGFNVLSYPGIKDSQFDLLPMIMEALEIKQGQQASDLNIIASAWTAPAWMKDIEDWYVPGSAKNNYNGTGGALKPEYQGLFAEYIIRYLDAYKQAGVNIWGLTPVNEPLGNSGQWESMHFSAESQNEFIKGYLGPELHKNGYADIDLLMLDHSRDHLTHWADVIYNDPVTSQYVSGAAVHWYESTYKVYEEVFDSVHERYPDFSIIHTEGTIDDLGKDAPAGVLDPEGFKESGWFANDDFWWNANATDWAYSVTWQGVKAEDHPMYTPVHRYARNIIVSLNHWMSGWIDWNVVLDQQGGPNHVGNFCGAPIMIDTASGYVYYTPIYYVLAQFSQTIRPGDKAVHSEIELSGLGADDLHAFASINKDHLLSVQILNTTKKTIEINLQVGEQYAPVSVEANALLTVRIQLPLDG